MFLENSLSDDPGSDLATPSTTADISGVEYLFQSMILITPATLVECSRSFIRFLPTSSFHAHERV